MTSKARFLWIDDEIDLLKPYVLFLEEKGYTTECAGNGHDALEMCRSRAYDIIFLDEHMPGLSGLETLTRLHRFMPRTPVVMVTKSEDEGIMNQAIGKKIADYLIKPVNPHQVLSSIKKLLEKRELIGENAATRYPEANSRLDKEIRDARLIENWMSIYQELVYWEMELESPEPASHPLREMVAMQKAEANRGFARHVQRNYETWVSERKHGERKHGGRKPGENGENGGNGSAESTDRPLMSPDLFGARLFPILDNGEKLFLILIDNFRFDQWRAVRDEVSDLFACEEELYVSILPTATPYARNSLFAGLMPRELAGKYPDLWVDEADDEGKNEMEEQLIARHLQRTGRKCHFSYHKINSNQEGERLLARFSGLEDKDFNVLVFNFMDMMSHARTESWMLRELVSDEAAYRTLTRSWFLRSPLHQLLKAIAGRGYKAVITTDHGAIRVKNGVKVVGDRETNSNPRYKLGKNLAYDPKRVHAVTRPENAGLPAPNVSTRYIFGRNDDFLVYPNNYNHYVSFYENTFQHGGISLEEMLVPFVTLSSK